MAYNNLSGTVFLPDLLTTQLSLPSGSILSGNLSTSDGADVVNVPRVSNATNNSIITNVGGNANTLTCESNLKFDGSTLNITGDLTASAGLSASFLYGDGRHLVNLPNSGGGGSGGGIFTEINASRAFTTSSVTIGSDATPTHRLSVQGGSFLSGAIIHKRVQISAHHTASTTDYYLGVNSSNGAVSIRLAGAENLADGQALVIKDEGGVAHTNNITILASGSQTIDGQNSVVLESPFASLQLYCNGANKYFIY